MQEPVPEIEPPEFTSANFPSLHGDGDQRRPAAAMPAATAPQQHASVHPRNPPQLVPPMHQLHQHLPPELLQSGGEGAYVDPSNNFAAALKHQQQQALLHQQQQQR
eukprot:213660-Prorocentrum_minimum.AAC.1